MKRRKFNRPITSTLSRLGFLLNRDLYIYIIDILYEKTTEITTIWQWRTKKRNVKFYLQIRYSQAMYSNNTFFLFYLLLFVISKRKIHLIHPISLLHFHQLVQNPRFTQKLSAPPLPSVRGGLLHLGMLEPFESEAPVCLPTRHTGWSSNLFEPWSATSSTKRTVRVERARPVLGKADVARNYRRTWRGLKKERKKERGRERKKRRGRGGDEARRFETILSNGRSRFVDALHEVTLPESFSSIRENNSFEQREM